MLRSDLEKLQQAGLTPTEGDADCLLLGHIVRLVVWQLYSDWQDNIPVNSKLDQVRKGMQRVYPLDLLHRLAMETLSSLLNEDLLAHMRVQEEPSSYDIDEIPF
jgi:hypothetical protein